MTETYGGAGRFGVGVPQSNPTVEAEFGVLLPRTASLHVTRLTSRAEDPIARLRAYLTDLAHYLEAYDGLKLAAFAFACTGSSYLVGKEEEAEIVAACAARFGYPIAPAADSIVWALEKLNARRIAVIAPYPAALIEAGHAYFESRGIHVQSLERIVTSSADTRSIYLTGVADARAALARVPTQGIDAILISGTGMPSLAEVDTHGRPPILSSNLCAAARALDLAGKTEMLDALGIEPQGWRRRLDEAYGRA